MCKVNVFAPSSSSYKSSKKRRRPSQPQPSHQGEILSPQHTDHAAGPDFKLITRYKPILFVDYLGPGELLVVERPMMDVLGGEGVPPAYWRPRYGE